MTTATITRNDEGFVDNTVAINTNLPLFWFLFEFAGKFSCHNLLKHHLTSIDFIAMNFTSIQDKNKLAVAVGFVSGLSFLYHQLSGLYITKTSLLQSFPEQSSQQIKSIK